MTSLNSMKNDKKNSILVVDDSPESIKILSAVLSAQYEVRVANSGVQALKVVAAKIPNLILLDIMMRGMDGYEVCAQLKSNPATRDIPVIFISALDSVEDETKGLSLGAIDYITKPIRTSIALARIQNHLGLKHYQDKLQAINHHLEERVREEVDKNMEFERLGLLGKLFDMGHEAVLITDERSRIVDVNKAFSAITGYSKDEVLGKTPKFLQSGRHGPDFYKQLWLQLSEQGFWQGEVWSKRKDGVIYPEWLGISVIRDQRGEVVNYISTFTNISEHMVIQEKFRHLALHDPLTGLPNRVAFNEQLERDIIRAERHKTKLAIIMMDLDHFKVVNDTLGHAAGDLLLIGAGGRMQACVRTDDFVCRLGGDEFVLVLHDVSSKEDVEIVCKKLLYSISEPYAFDDNEAYVTPSMGIAMFPDNGNSEVELLANADAAMYQTKLHGRANYTFYA